jgi:hypothetical protein
MAAALVAQPAAAQLRSYDAPRIESLAVESDGGLGAGATLRFDVYATPAARSAAVRLGTSDITVELRERRDGHYAGHYVVRRVDRIDPREPIVVRLAYRDRSLTRAFGYPPALLAATPQPAPSPGVGRSERPPQPHAARPATPPPAAPLPPAPIGPLTLAVTSHGNGATVIDDGKLTLAGRTAPLAEVHVHVDSISNTPGSVGTPVQVLDQVVRADANGLFEVPVTPSGFVIPGSRYEVRMSVTRGSQVVTQRLTLQRRPG